MGGLEISLRKEGGSTEGGLEGPGSLFSRGERSKVVGLIPDMPGVVGGEGGDRDDARLHSSRSHGTAEERELEELWNPTCSMGQPSPNRR